MSTDQRVMKKPLPLTDLFTRIQFQRLHSKQLQRHRYLKRILKYWLATVVMLCLFGCHTRVYNRWAGPFPIDFNQATVSLNDRLVYSRSFVQVELEEKQIEQVERVLNASSDNLSEGRLPYRLIQITDDVYVKLPPIDDDYYQREVLYHFQLFSERASKCILQQFAGSLERFMFTEVIEEIYRQNLVEFNMKLITKCGILLGQLYPARNELMYTMDSKDPVQFKESDLVLDIFPLSYSYMIFFPGIIVFSWFFIKVFIDLLIYVFHALHQAPLLIHLSVRNHLHSLQIDCLENLDDLLSHTTNENKYRNRLFLLRDRYLLILYLDMNERSTSTLHRFDALDPLTVIPVEQIVCIENNEILTKHGDQHTWHSLPMMHLISTKHTMQWLHQRLMHTSTTYQQCYADLEYRKKRLTLEWQKQEKLRRQQQKEQKRLRRQREKELKLQLIVFTGEEEEQQRILYQNNPWTIHNGVIPASPNLIAQFRLMNSEQINHYLSDTLCPVCHADIEYGESYAHWPCPAKHVFHYDCMLMVLRAHHVCPLCRHPVQRSDFILRLQNIIPL